jgi:hypothetical protein
MILLVAQLEAARGRQRRNRCRTPQLQGIGAVSFTARRADLKVRHSVPDTDSHHIFAFWDAEIDCSYFAGLTFAASTTILGAASESAFVRLTPFTKNR